MKRQIENMRTSDLVYRIRIENKMTKEEMAQAIGVNRMTIMSYEKGKSSISFQKMAMLVSRGYTSWSKIDKLLKEIDDEIYKAIGNGGNSNNIPDNPVPWHGKRVSKPYKRLGCFN